MRCALKIFRTLTVFTLILFSAPLLAKEDNERLEHLLVASGFKNAVAAFVYQVKLGLNQERLTNPKEALNDFEKKLYLEKLDADLLFQRVQQELAGKITDEQFDYLEKLYQQDLVRKALAEETASGTPEGMAAQTKYLQTLQQNPPDKETVQLFHEIESAYLTTEIAVFQITSIMRAKQKTIWKFNNNLTDENLQKLDYFISRMTDNLTGKMRKHMRMSLMYMYRDFNTQQLKSLLEFANDKKRLEYSMLAVDALNVAIVEGIQNGLTAVLDYRKQKQS
jgi:hypothetical protein